LFLRKAIITCKKCAGFHATQQKQQLRQPKATPAVSMIG